MAGNSTGAAGADAWCTLWGPACEVVCDPNEWLPANYTCREAPRYFLDDEVGYAPYVFIAITALAACVFNALMLVGLAASKRLDNMSFLIGHQTVTDVVFSLVTTPTFLIILAQGQWVANRAEPVTHNNFLPGALSLSWH